MADGEDRKLRSSDRVEGKMEFGLQTRGGRRRFVFGEPVKKPRVSERKG